MRYFRLFPVALLVCQVVWGTDPAPRSDSSDGSVVTAASARATVPRVLQQAEPVDDVILVLPGTSPKAAPAASAMASAAPSSTIVVKDPPRPDPDRPFLRRPKRNLPDDFVEDSAAYLHERLGTWDEAAARELLGEPIDSRPAYDDDAAVNGRIDSFSDPTGRYKQLELDFDQASGHLRTVFVYPYSMTWAECRQELGANVQATEANKGRIFYSYADRRLDVLVDPSGKVISLGMY
jgi:hypothetical protein